MGTGSYGYSQCSASNPFVTGSAKSGTFGFIGTGIQGLTESVRSIVPRFATINAAYTY